jgi:bla regulator protein blaR1
MSFDVASIKLHPWDPASGSYMPHFNFPLGDGDEYAATGGLLSDENLPVATYLVFAYKLSVDQRTNLKFPKWVANEHFDIEARGPASATKDQMRLMMQSLLAARCKLTVHWEDKQVPMFSVVLAKAGKIGPQLQRSVEPPCAPNQNPSVTAGGAACVRPSMGMQYLPNGEYKVMGHDEPMEQIAANLRFWPNTGIDRPLVNGTGLSGRFDFTLVWAPETPPGEQPQQDVSGPSYLDALNDQLGLKLISTVGSSHYLVIDHIEEPTPN